MAITKITPRVLPMGLSPDLGVVKLLAFLLPLQALVPVYLPMMCFVPPTVWGSHLLRQAISPYQHLTMISRPHLGATYESCLPWILQLCFAGYRNRVLLWKGLNQLVQCSRRPIFPAGTKLLQETPTKHVHIVMSSISRVAASSNNRGAVVSIVTDFTTRMPTLFLFPHNPLELACVARTHIPVLKQHLLSSTIICGTSFFQNESGEAIMTHITSPQKSMMIAHTIINVIDGDLDHETDITSTSLEHRRQISRWKKNCRDW